MLRITKNTIWTSSDPLFRHLVFLICREFDNIENWLTHDTHIKLYKMLNTFVTKTENLGAESYSFCSVLHHELTDNQFTETYNKNACYHTSFVKNEELAHTIYTFNYSGTPWTEQLIVNLYAAHTLLLARDEFNNIVGIFRVEPHKGRLLSILVSDRYRAPKLQGTYTHDVSQYQTRIGGPEDIDDFDDFDYSLNDFV